MDVRLSALKAAAHVAAARGGMLAADRQPDAAELVYGTALDVLHALLAGEAEAQTGWLRAAAVLCDMRQRIGLDALGVGRGEHLGVRLAALQDLPEIAATGSLADVYDGISAAIAIGAPRYNAGDVRGCCVVYWATMQTLLLAPVVRGAAGYARALAPMRTLLERELPSLPRDARGADEYAWELRRAFDASLKLAG